MQERDFDWYVSLLLLRFQMGSLLVCYILSLVGFMHSNLYLYSSVMGLLLRL